MEQRHPEDPDPEVSLCLVSDSLKRSTMVL